LSFQRQNDLAAIFIWAQFVNVGYSSHEKIKKKRIKEIVKIIWKSMKWKTGKKE
jgi:hypothetical protein